MTRTAQATVTGRAAGPLLSWIVPTFATVAAVAALWYTYQVADTRGSIQVGFWVAVAAVIAGIVPTLISRRVSERVRFVWLTVTVAIATMPKLLLSNGQAIYPDEFSHLRVARDWLVFGEPTQAGLVRLAPEYPGMGWLISTIYRIGEPAGISLEWAGLIVAAGAHIALALGVYSLIRTITGSGRGGTIGALIYMSGPSYLFFDAQIAYETLALPLLMFALVASAKAINPARDTTARVISTAAGAALIAAVAVTHHLTAYAAVAICLTWATWQQFSKTTHAARWPLWTMAAWSTIAVAAWNLPRLDNTSSYLAPSVGGPIQAFIDQITGEGGARTPFSGSTLPLFEQIAGWLLPVAVGAVVAWSLWQMRVARGTGTGVPTFVKVSIVLTAGYFASLVPLVLGGAEGARRTWAISYLGIAALVAWAATRRSASNDNEPLGRAVDAQPSNPEETGRRHAASGSTWQTIAVAALVVELTVGGIAAGVNEATRLPGDAIVGGDARAYDADARAVGDWFAANTEPRQRYFADRFVRPIIGLDGLGQSINPSDEYPIWQLTLNTALDARTIAIIAAADIDWIVIDERMASDLPAVGYWYVPGEPARGQTTPIGKLATVACQPWLQARHQSGPYTIYQVDRDTLSGANWQNIADSINNQTCP